MEFSILKPINQAICKILEKKSKGVWSFWSGKYFFIFLESSPFVVWYETKGQKYYIYYFSINGKG